MGFDSVEGNVKLVGDLPLREIGTKQPEHGDFSITQLVRVRRR
jgi:hypothetical protein